MLEIGKSCLIVIDVQGKLAQLVVEKEALLKNIQILIKAFKIMNVPILFCQQRPEALGPTLPEIAELLGGIEPVNKTSFSCCGNKTFSEKIDSLGRKQVVICGIESHVCVYQTAVNMREKEFEVAVAADAVSSRTPANKQIALDAMKAEGVKIASVEMILFELLKTADHAAFKRVAALIK